MNQSASLVGKGASKVLGAGIVLSLLTVPLANALL